MAGASPTKDDSVLIVIDNEYERRYFYSATAATRGLGWLTFPTSYAATRYGVKPGKVKVYRLDTEASDTLTRDLVAAEKIAKTDPATGDWTKGAKENFKALFVSLTNIRRT